MNYESIESVIRLGGYTLPDMSERISTMYMFGRITKEESDKLLKLAIEKADNSVDLPTEDERIAKLFIIVTNICTSLNLDEDGIKLIEEEDSNNEEQNETKEEYPPFVKPYGGHDAYYSDKDKNKCSLNGKNYICVAPAGYAVIYSPSEFPTFWKEVKGE